MAKTPTYAQAPPIFHDMMYEVFKVCCRLIATVFASTKTNEVRRGLFCCSDGLAEQVV